MNGTNPLAPSSTASSVSWTWRKTGAAEAMSRSALWSQSSLSSSQLVNHVKSTWQPRHQVSVFSFPMCPTPFACCRWHLHKETQVGACESTDGTINSPIYRTSGGRRDQGFKSTSTWLGKCCVQILNLSISIHSCDLRPVTLISLSLSFHIYK